MVTDVITTHLLLRLSQYQKQAFANDKKTLRILEYVYFRKRMQSKANWIKYFNYHHQNITTVFFKLTPHSKIQFENSTGSCYEFLETLARSEKNALLFKVQ